MTKKHPLVACGLIDPELLRKYPELQNVEIRIEEVTPGKAKEWLKINTRNRSLRKKQIDYLMQSLRQEGGRFSTNSIAFRSDGTILDGQHRLEAIVATEISMPCVIIRGAPDDADEIEDHIAPRQARDLVKTKAPDLKNATDKVTIPLAYWRLQAMKPASSWTQARWDKNVYTKNYIANFVVENDKKLSWALSLVHNTQADLIFFPRGAFAALALLLADRSSKKASSVFFHRLTTGENLKPGDPVLWLRNYLLQQTQAKASKGTESTDPLQIRMALLLMAWNDWVEGNTRTRKPTIYRKDRTTGMQGTVAWPVPKRPGGEYKPWLEGEED